MKAVLVLLVLGTGAGRPAACAQAPPRAAQAASPDTVRPGGLLRNAVQLWGGWSPGSVRLFGIIEGARFWTLGARYLRVLDADTSRVVEYTADVLPVATMTYDPVRGAPPDAVRRGERTLYGVGLTPAGLRVRARTGGRWEPYFEGGLGFVYFSNPLPDRRGERFNFTLRVGLGVRVAVQRQVALTFGWRFHHLSNGFRGYINPGFDSHLFHLGVTLMRF